METYAGKNIWLIGASSGIGHALALELDGKGAQLAISSRNSAELDILNNKLSCRHLVAPCDVTDPASISSSFDIIKKAFIKIDSIIFLSGTYEVMDLDKLDMMMSHKIVQTNLMGPLNLINIALPFLLAQHSGQIAFCASVAGYRGLPHAQPYGATKAALINLTESLRAEVGHRGIDVRLINPGFVRTPMTDKNKFPMPMMIEADEAAREIAHGLLRSGFEIHFPKRFSYIMKILRILPSFIYFKVLPR